MRYPYCELYTLISLSGKNSSRLFDEILDVKLKSIVPIFLGILAPDPKKRISDPYVVVFSK